MRGDGREPRGMKYASIKFASVTVPQKFALELYHGLEFGFGGRGSARR